MDKTILIVDDESDILRELSFILKKNGFRVYEGINGQECLNLSKQYKPNLIILDLYMPVLDGIAAAKIIKNDEELKSIPIILLTASIDNIKEKQKECSANDYVFKPFDYHELLKKINKLIQ